MAPPRTSSASRQAGRKLGSIRSAMDELNAPPSSSRFCPTMKPMLAEHRKAQASPNSAGSPTRPAASPSRVPDQFVDRPVRCACGFLEAAAQPVGQERAGQDVVDDDVMLAICRARPATKPVRPARAPLLMPSSRDRRLHRGRGDVDDAAELPLDHAVHHGLDHEDRRQHVGVDRLDPVVAAASRGSRRAAGHRRCSPECRGPDRRRARQRGQHRW